MTKPTRCIILTRVSTDAQTDNTSHQTQDEICTRFASERGWPVVARFHETESGAMYHTRVDTQAALTMLERDEADILLLYDMSRYGRDVEFQHKMLKRIVRAGKQLQFTTLRLEYDPYTGELTVESYHIFSTFGSTSAVERQHIRRRTRNGCLKAAREGRQPSRVLTPVGYRVVRKEDVIRGTHTKDEEGKYVLVESEVPTARAIFDLYEQHKSVRRTAALLTQQGYPTRSGRPWRQSTLQDILRNPLYKGLGSYGRFKYQYDDSRIERGLTKRFRSSRPPEEVITFAAPAIISEEQWERVNLILAEGGKKRSGSNTNRYPLTGLVFCALCGRRCYSLGRPHGKRRNTAKRPYSVKCGTARPPTTEHKGGCSAFAYDANRLETMVIHALERVLLAPDMVSSAQQAFKAHQDRLRRAAPKVDTKALEREIEALRKREKVAVEAAIDARLAGRPAEAYEIAAATATEKRTVLEARIAKQEATPISVAALPVMGENMVREILHTLGDEDIPGIERGDIFSTLVESVHPLLGGKFDCVSCPPAYRTGGVAVILKTARPGPYYVLWNRLQMQEGKSKPQPTITMEILDEFPLPVRIT